MITMPPELGPSGRGDGAPEEPPSAPYPWRTLLMALTLVVTVIVIGAVLATTVGASAVGGCGGG